MTIRRATRLLAAACCLGACAAVAAAPPAKLLNIYTDSPDRVAFQTYADSPGWKFFRTDSYCYASEQNDRGVLLIGYNRALDQAHVGFWNKEITSYRDFDRINFEIVLVNVILGVGMGEPDRTWGSNQYLVEINRDGQHVFNTKLDGTSVLNSFSRFDHLFFFAPDNTAAQQFMLGRPVHAMNHLRTCTPAA